MNLNRWGQRDKNSDRGRWPAGTTKGRTRSSKRTVDAGNGSDSENKLPTKSEFIKEIKNIILSETNE